MTYEIGSVGPSVLLSALSSVSPGVFLELKVFSWNFLKFGMVPETHLKLCITEPNFLEKLYAPKMGKKGFFFEIIGKFGHSFFLNLSYNLFCSETLSYYLCSCTNPILGKNLVPEIWTKMISANHIAGFLNQLYLQKKLMKWSDFLHADTNLQKLKTNWIFFCAKIGVVTLVTGL